jgi:hypothetical protein
VKQLSPEQRELVSSLAKRLSAVTGIKAVVLGGSHDRVRAQAGSDIDLGLLYSETAPFAIQDVRRLAEELNDIPGPVVTEFYGWGAWVNGGAWLTIGGQRVDFIYRNLEQVERVIADAERGVYEVDYAQQPPFGFFSGTYLGEVAVCIPLFDFGSQLDMLKRRVAQYPDALRRAVVQDCLWQAEFCLAAFAGKFAARSDAYGTAACLTRALNQIVHVVFALNRRYPINDKTALAEVAEFERAPQEFALRIHKTLAHVGASSAELVAAVESIAQLHREVVGLADGVYQPRFTLTK